MSTSRVAPNNLTPNPIASNETASVFRSLARLALTGHALILVATAALGIWPLVVINVISVFLYGIALKLNAHRWYIAVLGVGFVEVTIHAILATSILGWDSGFHIYLLALVPLVFFFDPWSLRSRAIASGAVIAIYVFFAWYAYERFPQDPRPFVDYFRYGNLTVGAVVLAALSYYYGTAVHRAQIDLEEKNRQLDELSRTDPLTELSNRREAVAILEYECARSLRASDQFAIALVDIDHFKSINDGYGHDTGDRVLRELALLLRSSLRAQDSVARWGGEEFLIILPQTGTDGARTVAEKVRQAVAERIHECGDSSFSVTVTIGIAIYDHEASLEQVIRDADASLYRGKECGRNQVCCSWDES